MDSTPLINKQDVENGFKDIEVKYKHGERETIRLTGISFRETGLQSEALLKHGNMFLAYVAPCLPEQYREEKFLNRLVPSSAALVENTALALTFGEEEIKKTLAIMEEQIVKATQKPGEEQKLPS
jgi:hypothetical protein